MCYFDWMLKVCLCYFDWMLKVCVCYFDWMLKVCVCVILQDSYRQCMKMRSKDLRKRLMIKFRGEEGLDYGGVARYAYYSLFS